MQGYLLESQTLHFRARAFVHAFEDGLPTPEPFEELGLSLARFQAKYVKPYARLCVSRGVDPVRCSTLQEIPAVPTEVFRLTRVASFGEESTVACFRTSGTTAGRQGQHAFRDLESYQVAALASGRRALLPTPSVRVPVLVLGPSSEEAPESSLAHMLSLFVEKFGLPAEAQDTYFVTQGCLRSAHFVEKAKSWTAAGIPALLVLGTSFAFVELLDALHGERIPLPTQSRVMQTGGFKGKSRVVEASVLQAALCHKFALPPNALLSEYSMTELSSQFYTVPNLSSHEPDIYEEPPWARVVPVDPLTLLPVPDGDIGLARIEDLMNVDSAFAVLTSDRVRRVPGGFQLLGRASDAPPRGCSLAVEELLGHS